MARKKPKKPKKDEMAFTNVGSVENEFSGNVGSANPISFSATIPDLAADSVGVVLLSVLAAAAGTGVISSVVWDGITGTKAIPASNSFLTQTVHAYYWINPPDNGSKTIQVNFSAPGSGDPVTVTVHITVGYADAANTVELDDTSENTGVTGAGATVTSTQADANELVFSASSHTANALGSPTTTDCTELQSWDSGGNCGISAYSIPVSSGDATHTHNYSQNGVWGAVSLSFREVADAGETKSLTDTGSGTDNFGSFHLLNHENFPLTPILDNFNRTTLAPNWSKYTGTAGNPTIVDNAFTVTGSSGGAIFWENGNFGAAIEFYWDIIGLNSTSGSFMQLTYDRTSMDSDEAFEQYFTVRNLTNSSVRLQNWYWYPIISDVLVADSGDVAFDPRSSIRVGVRHQLNGQVNLFLDRGNGWENVGSGTSNGIALQEGHLRWTLSVLPASSVPWISADNFGGGTLLYPSIFVSDSITDNSIGVDNPNLAASLGLSDLALGGDLLDLSASLSLSDVGSGIDDVTVSVLEIIIKSICDYGIGIDAPELIGWLVDECSALLDSNGSPLVDGTVGEELYIRITALLSLLDSASATETTSISASIPVVDIGFSNETITLSATLSLNDTGTGLDDVSVSTAEAVLKTISDVASALDTINISATLSTTETSTGQDALSLSVSFSLVDTASGIDSPDIAATLGVIDTALGGDFIGLSAVLQLIDSGLGEDQLSNLIASLSVGDSALGTDEINVLAGLLMAISEFGTGSDEVANILASLSVSELGTITEVVSQIASLSLSDIAIAIDDPQIAASLGITEGALGGDFIDLSASLSLSEAGSGIDTLNQLLASLSLSESGNANDLLQLLASLSINDLGSGSDEVSVLAGVIKSILDSGLGSDEVSISVDLSVQDTGIGTDALSIFVSLSVLDTGTGLDEETVNKVEILFKSISDIASGSDNLSIAAALYVNDAVIGIDDPAILASLSVGDLAETFDSPVISAVLTITDTASATDLISILQSILKQITDVGTGTDAISQITASIPVSETGLGTDQIGQLLASLLVTDFGTGVDAIVKYDTTTQIIKISFIIKNNTISFAMKANNINFDLSTSSIVTDTSDPTIGMTFSAPSISFSLNPDGG